MRAALAAAILLFLPGLLDPFSGPKAFALQLVGLPLLAFVAAERWGAPRARDLDHPTPDVVRAIDLTVVAWVAVALLSTLFGLSPRLSWAGEIGQREGLLTTLALAGLYAGARRSHASVAHVRGTLLVVLTCAVLAAVYGLAQRAGLDPLHWETGARYPSGAGAVLRAFGTSGNAILLGAILAGALGIGIVLAGERGRSGWLTWSLALLGAAIAATLSRSAFLGAAAGAVVALAAIFRVEAGRPDRGRLLAIGAALALAIVWAVISLRGPMAARLAESADPRAESAPARVEMARAVFTITTRRPLLGVGPDAFGLAFPAVQSARYWRNSWLGDPAHAHSTALQVLATLGLLGALVGLVWVTVLAVALQPRRVAGEEERAIEIPRAALFAGLAALLVAGLFNPVGLAGAALFVTISAMPAALRPAGVGESAPPAARPPALALVLAGLVVLAVVLGSIGGFRALAAAQKSQGALLQELDLPAATRPLAARVAGEWAARASAAAPREDQLWRLRCDAALAGVANTPPGPGRDSLAADALASARRAVALEPRRGSNFDRLANAYSALGRWPEADSAFAAAVALAPVDPFIRLDRHRSEMTRGRPDLALRTAQALAALYPEESTSHAAEAAAWLGMGRRPEAIGALKRALAARWEADSEVRHEAARRWLRALEGDSLPEKPRK